MGTAVLLSLLFLANGRAHADPLYNLSGVMRDGRGSAVEGVAIRFYCSPLQQEYTVQTDVNGYYSTDVEPCQYEARITNTSESTDYVPTITYLGDSQYIDVTEGDIVQDMMLDTSLVTVSVKDVNGIPVSGVDVTLVATGNGVSDLIPGEIPDAYANRNGVSNRLTTDENGLAVVSALNGLDYSVCAYTRGGINICSPTEIRPLADGSGNVAEVNFPQMHTISGTVYGANNQPVPNLYVSFGTSPAQAAYTGAFVTDDLGHYSAELLPGNYYGHVGTIGNMFSEHTPRSFSLIDSSRIDATNSDVVLDFTLDVSAITVTVKNADGSPHEMAYAELYATGIGNTTLFGNNPLGAYAPNDAVTVSQGFTDDNGQVTLLVLNGMQYKSCSYDSNWENYTCAPMTFIAGIISTTEVVFP